MNFFSRRVLEIERERARAHRRRGIGAEEPRHEQLGGEPAVAVAVREEDGVPLLELRQHGGGFGRDDDAGQDAAVVALDQLLALAHAHRRIALRVLEQELDRPPDHAALGVGHLLDQPAGAHHLAAEDGVAAGDHGRDADLDRPVCAPCVAQERRRRDQRRACQRRFEHAAARDCLHPILFFRRHDVLPGYLCFVSMTASGPVAIAAYSSSTVSNSAGRMISSSSQSSE